MGDERVIGLGHDGLGFAAGERMDRETEVIVGADISDLPVEGQELGDVWNGANRFCVRYETPSGARSKAVWVRQKFAAHATKARRSTLERRTGCKLPEDESGQTAPLPND